MKTPGIAETQYQYLQRILAPPPPPSSLNIRTRYLESVNEVPVTNLVFRVEHRTMMDITLSTQSQAHSASLWGWGEYSMKDRTYQTLKHRTFSTVIIGRLPPTYGFYVTCPAPKNFVRLLHSRRGPPLTSCQYVSINRKNSTTSLSY